MRLRKTKMIRYKENDEAKTAVVEQLHSTGRKMQAPGMSRHQIFTLPFKRKQIEWMDEVMKKRDCDIIRILNRIRPDVVKELERLGRLTGDSVEVMSESASTAYDAAESVLEQFQEWAKDLPAEKAKRIKTEYEAWIEFKLSGVPCSVCRQPVVNGQWHDHPCE